MVKKQLGEMLRCAGLMLEYVRGWLIYLHQVIQASCMSLQETVCIISVYIQVTVYE